MAKEQMHECEQKKPFMVIGEPGKRVNKWAVVKVSDISAASKPEIRCMHCHGPLKLHKPKVPRGPMEHIEHKERQDSEGCEGGIYFKGTHKMSQHPIA
jgi:uncharacterized protein with PIN domain